MSNYDKPVIAMAASRTARVIKGIRSLILAREVYSSVRGGSGSAAGEDKGSERMPPRL